MSVVSIFDVFILCVSTVYLFDAFLCMSTILCESTISLFAIFFCDSFFIWCFSLCINRFFIQCFSFHLLFSVAYPMPLSSAFRREKIDSSHISCVYMCSLNVRQTAVNSINLIQAAQNQVFFRDKNKPDKTLKSTRLVYKVNDKSVVNACMDVSSRGGSMI